MNFKILMQKKFLLILGFLLAFPLTIQKTFGIALDDFNSSVFRPDNLPAPSTVDISAEGRINEVIDFSVNLILFASGSVAVLVLVIGGVMYVTSMGNDDGIDRAKKLIKFAALGLAAVTLSYAAVTNIVDLIFRATT